MTPPAWLCAFCIGIWASSSSLSTLLPSPCPESLVALVVVVVLVVVELVVVVPVVVLGVVVMVFPHNGQVLVRLGSSSGKSGWMLVIFLAGTL